MAWRTRLVLVLGLTGAFLLSPLMHNGGAAQTKPEATSLLGTPLYPLELSAEEKAKLEENLKQAQADYDRNPKDAEAIIWLGRRLAYLHRYREAIEVYSKGMALHPDDPRFYRHRGHRHITLREFDKAVADFERAASLIQRDGGKPDEVEPSGTGGRPSTLHFNIWYHKGLAHYLLGDFKKALSAYLECMKVSKRDSESLVATSDLLYMTYRRLGSTGDAAELLEPITEDMGVKENTSYYRRLLMYKGKIPPQELLDAERADDLVIATQGIRRRELVPLQQRGGQGPRSFHPRRRREILAGLRLDCRRGRSQANGREVDRKEPVRAPNFLQGPGASAGQE